MWVVCQDGTIINLDRFDGIVCKDNYEVVARNYQVIDGENESQTIQCEATIGQYDTYEQADEEMKKISNAIAGNVKVHIANRD